MQHNIVFNIIYIMRTSVYGTWVSSQVLFIWIGQAEFLKGEKFGGLSIAVLD